MEYLDAGVYIFLFAPPPQVGAKVWAFEGLGEEIISSLSKKKEKERQKYGSRN